MPECAIDFEAIHGYGVLVVVLTRKGPAFMAEQMKALGFKFSASSTQQEIENLKKKVAESSAEVAEKVSRRVEADGVGVTFWRGDRGHPPCRA